MRQLVLVVEDDVAIRRGVADALRYAGFEPLEAGDGVAGLRLALERDRCGWCCSTSRCRSRTAWQCSRELRAARPGLPVILITARGGEDDRVRGLRLGADDYVVKPFSVRELLARVDAVLRRSAGAGAEAAVLALPAGTSISRPKRCASTTARHETLTALEARLLRFLAGASHRFVSRDELLVHVWQADPRSVHTRSVDMAIARLRRKLRDDDRPPRVVVAVRGRGYRLEGACAVPR